jgi:putative SOS response-associated peptidase YedK
MPIGHEAGVTSSARACSISSNRSNGSRPSRSSLVYEWKKIASGKQPYAIALKDRRLMGMAGLWGTWGSPAGERIRSFTITSTLLNELCAELHNRMPAALKPEAWPLWLGEQPAEMPQLKALLAPYPSEDMIAGPSTRASATSRRPVADRAACRVLTTGHRREGTIRGLLL